MKIECKYDPDILIDQIGDRFFSIEIDENLTFSQRESESIVVIDCERGVTIQITTEYGKCETLITAEALIKLLNQEYEFIPCGE